MKEQSKEDNIVYSSEQSRKLDLKVNDAVNKAMHETDRFYNSIKRKTEKIGSIITYGNGDGLERILLDDFDKVKECLYKRHTVGILLEKDIFVQFSESSFYDTYRSVLDRDGLLDYYKRFRIVLDSKDKHANDFEKLSIINAPGSVIHKYVRDNGDAETEEVLYGRNPAVKEPLLEIYKYHNKNKLLLVQYSKSGQHYIDKLGSFSEEKLVKNTVFICRYKFE